MTASGFTMRRYWIALIILVGMTVIPFIVAFAANWLLQINNCAFDLKGGTHCLIGGSDWGPALGFVYLWASAVAATLLWASVAGLAVWSLLLVKGLARWRKGTGREAL